MPNDLMEEVISEQGVEAAGRRLKPASNGKLRISLVVLALLAAVAGTASWYHFRDRVSTDNAQVDGHLMPVASKIYGNVAEVLVLDNQKVKAGQVLVKIDARDYQAKVDLAQAALALAQAQAQAAKAGVPLTAQTTASGTSGAEALLAAAQADYNRARAAYEQAAGAEISYARSNVESKQAVAERARADLARMRPLADKAEISRLQFDAYTSAERVTAGDLKAVQDRLNSALKAADTLKAAVLAAEARVQQARAGVAQSRASQGQVRVVSAQSVAAAAAVQQAIANLSAAELQLGYATIVAPSDGMVTRKSVEPGQVVQPGQSLLTVVPLHDVWVTANFKETQLGAVRVGQKAEIKVDMYGRSLPAHVDSISASTGARMSLLPPENATGNFVKVVQRIPVKLVFHSVPSDAVLRPGMNVDVVIFTR